MKYLLLKDWGKRKKGETIDLEDKAVIFSASKLGVIENKDFDKSQLPEGRKAKLEAKTLATKKEAEKKGTPQTVSTQSGSVVDPPVGTAGIPPIEEAIVKKGKNETNS